MAVRHTFLQNSYLGHSLALCDCNHRIVDLDDMDVEDECGFAVSHLCACVHRLQCTSLCGATWLQGMMLRLIPEELLLVS